MLIVMTQDQAIMDWCLDSKSKAPQWQKLNFVNGGGAPAATVQLKRFLGEVEVNEDLCLTGHGNDDEVGDVETSGKQSWNWSVSELADLLANLPNGYTGTILIEVCSASMTSFAAKLAVALGKNGSLKGVWIYGYDKPVSVTHIFPNPTKLAGNVELIGHQC